MDKGKFVTTKDTGQVFEQKYVASAESAAMDRKNMKRIWLFIGMLFFPGVAFGLGFLGYLYLDSARVEGVFLVSVAGFAFVAAFACAILLLEWLPPGMAAVRTGFGKRAVFRLGAFWVLPIPFHHVVYVPLESELLSISRVGEDACLFKDYCEAEVEATFIVKVADNNESIIKAVNYFGSSIVQTGRRHFSAQAKELISENLIAALRKVCAKVPLADILSDKRRLAIILKGELLSDECLWNNSGLRLETVTVIEVRKTQTERNRTFIAAVQRKQAGE